MKTAIELIAEERLRQQTDEGWSAAHDDGHDRGELAAAGAVYATVAADISYGWLEPEALPEAWPWDAEWYKPSPDPIRNLVKAGALIVAEIERLQRLQK